MNLVGFEFRIFDKQIRAPWGDYHGISLMLSPREEFIKFIMSF
jgi:hypothetical protein